MMGKFYQYDTRGASASDQIMTLERLLESAESRLDAALDLLLDMRQHQGAIQPYVKRIDEVLSSKAK